jgi:uncharacterized membrane protein YcjF (UPF0283 family)
VTVDWSLWEVIWTSFVIFIWISVLIIFVNVIVDVFRSDDLSGWGKAGWLIALVVLPFLGLLIYVITRGPGMSQRAVRQQLERADSIREAMGASAAGDPAAEIARAKELLDTGAIDGQEFETLKARALAG